MKTMGIIFLVVAVLFIVPLVWLCTGWIAVSAIEVITGREIVTDFVSFGHLVIGLAVALAGGIVARASN